MSSPNIGQPPQTRDPNARIEWCVNALFEIQRFLSRTDIANTTDAFTLTGTLTANRTLDAAAGTATDVRNTLATLIDDMRRRGSKGV